ncbi:MAG: ATP-binding protein [Sphingomicrobium sp.]
MASVPGESDPVSGRIDRDGKLVSADPPLLRLQQAAGSDLCRPLALPQLAALARSALTLVVPLSRAVLAADDDHDLDLWVRAEPDGDGVTIRIERWSQRAPTPPRLALVSSNGEPEEPEAADPREADLLHWATDAELHFTRLSPALAALLGTTEEGAAGQPLTRLFRLMEDDDGRMPLLSALAAREEMLGQRAQPRSNPSEELRLSAQPMLDPDGRFTGFTGRAVRDHDPADTAASPPVAEESLLLDHALDEALRSPLDRIISAADRIVERTDGPLRSDYASYAGDIAAAGRHLLSVIRSMTEEASISASAVDMVAVVHEAVGLVEPAAEAGKVEIEVERPELRVLARGEARGIVQILVNILGNAIRHSPNGGTVAIVFELTGPTISVTIADQGPGIDRTDQQRIFERYERVGSDPDGAGLGLAISRRLARSMGGDIALESARGEGARFTLVLPAG